MQVWSAGVLALSHRRGLKRRQLLHAVGEDSVRVRIERDKLILRGWKGWNWFGIRQLFTRWARRIGAILSVRDFFHLKKQVSLSSIHQLSHLFEYSQRVSIIRYWCADGIERGIDKFPSKSSADIIIEPILKLPLLFVRQSMVGYPVNLHRGTYSQLPTFHLLHAEILVTINPIILRVVEIEDRVRSLDKFNLRKRVNPGGVIAGWRTTETEFRDSADIRIMGWCSATWIPRWVRLSRGISQRVEPNISRLGVENLWTERCNFCAWEARWVNVREFFPTFYFDSNVEYRR